MDIIPSIVAVLADHGHRHLALLDRELFGGRERICREDVVERRQPTAPARLQEHAEVLGVPIDGGQEPEDDDRPKEGRPILRRLLRLQEVRRLSGIMGNTASIRDVLLFPHMRPEA